MPRLKRLPLVAAFLIAGCWWAAAPPAVDGPHAQAASSLADENRPLDDPITFPGFAHDLAYADGRVVVAQGTRLAVVDIADLRRPRLRAWSRPLVSPWPVGERVDHVAAVGAWAFATTSEDQLRAVHIGGDAPAPASSLWLGREALAIAARPGLAAVAIAGQPDGSADPVLVLVDVHRPRKLHEQARLSLPGAPVTGLAFHGPHLLAATRQGVAVVDVSEPAAPYVLAFAPIAHPEADEVATALLAPDGDVVWLAARYVEPYTGPLWALSLADPSSPTVLARLDPPVSVGAQGLAAAGGRVLMSRYEGGLALVDGSRPTAPRWLGVVPHEHEASSIAFPGQHAFLLNERLSGMAIFDATFPNGVRHVASLALTGRARVVAADGRRVALSGPGRAIHLVDVRQTTQPEVLATVDLGQIPGGGRPYLEEMAFSGPNLYLLFRDRLVVVAAEPPEAPRVIGHVLLEDRHDDVAVHGDHAVVATHQSVTLIDVQAPSRPTVLDSRPLVTDGERGVSVRDVALTEEAIFVAVAGRGVLSFPRGARLQAPRQATANRGATALAVFDTTVHVCEHGALHTYGTQGQNLTPRHASVTQPWTCLDLSAGRSAGRDLVVHGVEDGLHIVDVTDPQSPIQRPSLPLPSYSADVTFHGGQVLAAASSLAIYRSSVPFEPVTQLGLPWLSRAASLGADRH